MNVVEIAIFTTSGESGTFSKEKNVLKFDWDEKRQTQIEPYIFLAVVFLKTSN